MAAHQAAVVWDCFAGGPLNPNRVPKNSYRTERLLRHQAASRSRNFAATVFF
jgi:hypothetical protein